MTTNDELIEKVRINGWFHHQDLTAMEQRLQLLDRMADHYELQLASGLVDHAANDLLTEYRQLTGKE